MSPVPSMYGVILKLDGNKLVALDSTVEEDFDKMTEFVGNVYTDLSNFGIATELRPPARLSLRTIIATCNTKVCHALFQRMFDNKDKPELNIEHIAFYRQQLPP